MSRRPSWSRKLAWRLEAFALDVFTFLVRLAPVDAVSAAGGRLMRALGPLTPVQHTVLRNLQIAFPELTDAERRKLAADQWESVGRVFAEFPVIDRIFADPDRIRVVNGERLEQIARDGEPAVFISGHLSNWELMPAAIVRFGVDCLMTYRAANNPYVDARIREGRARYGVKLFAPKGESARDLLEALGRGQSVALMNDQKFNEGIAAPFFGEPAMTAPGPTRMALSRDAVLQPMSVRRLEGARFEVIVHDPIRPERTGDRAHDVEAGVRRINAWLESEVRANPIEWFWVHRRWPAAVYKAERS